MDDVKITVDNICDACERCNERCVEPCETWYKCLYGIPISMKEILRDGNG